MKVDMSKKNKIKNQSKKSDDNVEMNKDEVPINEVLEDSYEDSLLVGEEIEASSYIEQEQIKQSQVVAELESQIEDLNDKLLRALAETENVRRRTQREKEDALRYGIKSFAEKMIVVADNLSRAIQSIGLDIRKENQVLENIAVGVEMVERELLVGLEQSGVKQIDALGKSFDPMLHEAMFELEDVEVPSGTVKQVLEVGYSLHDRTLRAAKVGIAKGGPSVKSVNDKETSEKAQVENKNNTADQTAYDEKKIEPGSQLNEEL